MTHEELNEIERRADAADIPLLVAELRKHLGPVEWRACKICQSRMEISAAAFRSDREFCSRRCKQQDHRNKVTEAKRLRANGMDLASIARKLNTAADVVKNWLTKNK